ncbi:hypothetical protein A4X06_0g7371 [Tilletia controversa]|uniref:Peptidase A2 domain-containing protein n=2 Tax=Tilletia TaxID=13289 RepID=A0A8X7SU78_9BASI|nr:hypothetical protein CF336_g7260 [Tilletia laevis]KAE8188103.1 hypothetical protein CF328_g6714 [Tilletia controversa]KAE8189305.1 hypothetical protein CF335_g6660 [Tilletia laevis]KAE8241873.1 hypothetical protein A4X06_0g7371 [Tilletia controversa]KAE8245122.1 hypothetical protein A4X03_0g7501 [Tilletia caries]
MLVTDTGDGQVVSEIDKESVVLAVAAADAPIPLSAGVVLAAVRLARVQAGVAGAKESATCRVGQGDDSSALFFTERDAFYTAHSWSVEETRGPLSKPTRRGKHSVPLPSLPVVGTGLGYRRHVPLTTKIRVNDAEGVALPCLVDTGASLCSIDAALLAQLGGEAGGARIPIHGIGHTESLGYTTITFFVDAHDDRGMPVQLEARQDFHVLPSFAPGLLLGLDFIAAHHLVLEPGKGKASVGSYTFAVRESMTGPHAVEAELCLVKSVVVPARSQCWVPVDVGSLTPQIDYAVHPRVIVSMDESVQIVGPMALFNASRGHLLLTNVGSKEVVLDRRTPVADAVAARLGDVYVPTSGTFTLVPGLVPLSAPAYTHQTEIDPPSVPDSLPIDMFEGEHGFGSELAKDSATVLSGWTLASGS